MKTIDVSLKERAYSIYVEAGLTRKLPALLENILRDRRVVIVSQPALSAQSGVLQAILSKSGYTVSLLEIEDGERAKTLSQAEDLYRQLIQLKCDRSTTLLAFGGGTVGDLTGFVAATFLRGIPYIQVPTTLLAMVDSSIGGKTGVNLDEGKNLVGSIYQPLAVVVDTDLLKTLPRREIISGTAEILKYGAIYDKNFLQFLSDNLDSLIKLEDGIVFEAVCRSCAIKAEVVAADEHESDLRRILNFGHTLGHALEKIGGYDSLRHGEAVALGMLCAGSISNQRGYLDENEWKQLESTIRRLGLPEVLATEGRGVLELVKRDKKVKGGKVHFVLLDGIGNTVIKSDVSEDEILKSLEVL